MNGQIRLQCTLILTNDTSTPAGTAPLNTKETYATWLSQVK